MPLAPMQGSRLLSTIVPILTAPHTVRCPEMRGWGGCPTRACSARQAWTAQPRNW